MYSISKPALMRRSASCVVRRSVIGGISLNGGRGRLPGALTGVLLLGILQNVLALALVPAFWIDAAYGAIILVALILSPRIGRGIANRVRTMCRLFMKASTSSRSSGPPLRSRGRSWPCDLPGTQGSAMELRDRQGGGREGPGGGGIGEPMSRRGERGREHGDRRREVAANRPIQGDLVEAVIDPLIIAALRRRERPQQAALMPGQGEAAGTAEPKPSGAVPA